MKTKPSYGFVTELKLRQACEARELKQLRDASAFARDALDLRGADVSEVKVSEDLGLARLFVRFDGVRFEMLMRSVAGEV